MSKETKVPILSFYSGGGFMDMGFEMADFEIVWSNENDKAFAELHASGITSWRKSKGNGIKAEIFNTKSIVEISSNEILSEAFPNGKPLTFGIIGGPPCQDFSINGKLEGFKGERGKLTILFFDKILELKPTFFVMENVTGLIRGSAHKEYIKILIEKIEKYYIVDYKVLNALNYGVPQSRERVFFVGLKKEYLNIKNIGIDVPLKWFDWPINHKYNNALKKYSWPKVDEFGKKLIEPRDLPLELCVESCLVSGEKMSSIPNSDEFFTLKANKDRLLKIKEGETNRPSFKRLHRFRYSPTTCYGNNEVHMHPYENRRISVREALRIQGAPDTYILPKEIPLSKKFKMIGNGVPVPLAKAVADSIMQFLVKNKLLNN